MPVIPERPKKFLKLFKKIKGFVESKKTRKEKERDKLIFTQVTKRIK